MNTFTERQAWVYCAEVWRHAKPGTVDRVKGHHVRVGGYNPMGLCLTVIALYKPLGAISMATAMRMLDKVAPGHSTGFRFPLNAAGAKARVAFCEKQAKLLEKRTKKTAK